MGPNGAVPVIGVPSASAPPAEGIRSGGYAIHEIAENGSDYELTVIHRGYAHAGEIVETGRVTFSVSRP